MFKQVALFTFLMVGFYLATSFILWDINAANWGTAARYAYVFGGGLVSAFGVIVGGLGRGD